MYMNTIYVQNEIIKGAKVSQFLQNIDVFWQFSWKNTRYFVSTILDFGGHIGFYLYVNHTWLKLDINMYFYGIFYNCFMIKSTVTTVSHKTVIQIIADILNFSGHFDFKKLHPRIYLNVTRYSATMPSKFRAFNRMCTII